MPRCHIVPYGHIALYLKETHYVVGHLILSKTYSLMYCIDMFTEHIFNVNYNIV